MNSKRTLSAAFFCFISRLGRSHSEGKTGAVFTPESPSRGRHVPSPVLGSRGAEAAVAHCAEGGGTVGWQQPGGDGR